MYAYKGMKSRNIETENLNLLFQKWHAGALWSSLDS